MAVYTALHTKRNTSHKQKFISVGRAARWGFVRWGQSRWGNALISYTAKHSDRGTAYTDKY